jgi:hypothetical protein
VQRLLIHIERLLLTNDCVIIPEFGGFVLHPCPAVYQRGEHRFCPPGKGIVFNPALKHYDRLIPESYMHMYGMSFEDAHFSLRKDIEELHHILDNEGAVYFERIGFLRKDDVGNLFFDVERNASFAGLKPYGLYTFHLPPLAHNTQKVIQVTAQTIIKPETKSKRVVYFPVKQAFIRVAGISVAAVALFLFISMPVNDVGRSSYSANMISSDILSNSVYVPDTQDETTHVSVVEEDTVQYTAVAEETPPPPPVVQTLQPTVKAVEATTQKIYYAIIGSFVSEKQANQYMQQINIPELTNMGIVKNEERVRVYAEKFDKREDAQNYILRLRANERLKDTWLFVGQ